MILKRMFFVFILFAAATIVFGNGINIPVIKDRGKNLESFIPDGWKVLKKAEGDLNKDNLPDIAVVIQVEKKAGDSSSEMPRILFILFKEKNGTYKLNIQNGKAIFGEEDGGVFGDPFSEIKIDRGSILIQFYGGSSDRWGYSFRFRYQNNGWFLIGATLSSGNINTGEEIIKDFNLLTGKMETAETKADGKKSKKMTDRGTKLLLNLKDFDIFSFDESKI
jgi:hypothetical protein